MKLLTEEQIEGHRQATNRGVIEGTAGGLIASTVGFTYLQRTWPVYQRLPRAIKSLGYIFVVLPAMTIQAERRGLAYDKSLWDGQAGHGILEESESKEEQRWQSLTTKDKIFDWAIRNEYTMILGGWAASLALAGGIIWKDKYQTGPQKIVQARMWAQALTIGVLIAAGAMTHSRRVEAGRVPADNSWQDVLDAQERQKKDDQRRVRELQGAPA